MSSIWSISSVLLLAFLLFSGACKEERDHLVDRFDFIPVEGIQDIIDPKVGDDRILRKSDGEVIGAGEAQSTAVELASVTELQIVEPELPPLVSDQAPNDGGFFVSQTDSTLDFVPEHVYAVQNQSADGNVTTFVLAGGDCDDRRELRVSFLVPAGSLSQIADPFGVPIAADIDSTADEIAPGIPVEVIDSKQELRAGVPITNTVTLSFSRLPTGLGDYYQANASFVLDATRGAERLVVEMAGRVLPEPLRCN